MLKKIILVVTVLFIISDLMAQNIDTAGKNIALTIKAVKIEGTLLATSNKQKIVIIIAGSGPTDRDGNSVAGVSSNTYRLLASALQKNNIASFRYDKRGIAKSSYKNFKETDVVFDDYINDAKEIFFYLKDSLGFKNIFFAGHSEGSLIGMIAAQQTPAKGYISLAGAGRPINKIITEQVEAQSPFIAKQTDSLFNMLKTKGKIDSVPPYLMVIFRPSVQPYMVSWMKYDAAVEIKKVKPPVLILQGTCDKQVKKTEADLLYNANNKNTLKILEGMTHTLKNTDANCIDKDMKTYHDATLPLNEELVKSIVNFIRKN